MAELPPEHHTDATTTDIDPDCELFDWQAFRQNGLVWALNRYVLHPRGLALAVFTADGDEDSRGWQIVRADDGVWSFDVETDLDGRSRFDAFVAYVGERPAASQETPTP